MNEPINIVSLGGGALEELFERELAQVLENIADPNTKAVVKREITLKVSFLPNEEREHCVVEIQAASKLAGALGAATQVFLGERADGRVAVEFNPKQMNLDMGVAREGTND